MSYLQSFVLSLTYPLVLSATLLVLGLLALVLRHRRAGAVLCLLAVGWSGLWSVPWMSDQLRHTLEGRNPVVAEADLPKADAIVVLGGGQHYGWLERENVHPDDLPSSRLAAGARAWLAGRAPVVVLSGGGARGQTEADRMAAAIERLGVPPSALVLEERSRDTRGNALYTAELAAGADMHRVLLVTSALHMPRAQWLFREAGLHVVPVPVPEGGPRQGFRAHWVPSRSALWRSGRAFKEYAALLETWLVGQRSPPGRAMAAGDTGR